MFDVDWQELLIKLVTFAAQNPWQFVYYTVLILSPLFALSAFLSYKLIQEIDQKEKDTKKRQLRDSSKLNVARKKNE